MTQAATLVGSRGIGARLTAVKLLEHWNWYLPKWIEWPPHLEYDRPTEKVEAPPVLGPTG